MSRASKYAGSRPGDFQIVAPAGNEENVGVPFADDLEKITLFLKVDAYGRLWFRSDHPGMRTQLGIGPFNQEQALLIRDWLTRTFDDLAEAK